MNILIIIFSFFVVCAIVELIWLYYTIRRYHKKTSLTQLTYYIIINYKGSKPSDVVVTEDLNFMIIKTDTHKCVIKPNNDKIYTYQDVESIQCLNNQSTKN